MNTDNLKPLLEREFNVNETLQVLRRLPNNVYFLCWGVSKLVNIEDKGLLMKVNGNLHKGYVFVTLGWEDLYKVHIMTTHGRVKETIEGIFFEDLTELIDEKIEKIKEYRY